jgi:hypothetical protein
MFFEGFAEVTVDPETGTVVWPGAADLAPDTLYERVRTGARPDQDVAAQQPGSQSLVASVPIRYPNPRDFPVRAGEIISANSLCRNSLFAGISVREPALHALLAMQKVEGSNPFSRFREGLHLQAFSCLQSAGAFCP